MQKGNLWLLDLYQNKKKKIYIARLKILSSSFLLCIKFDIHFYSIKQM